MMTQGGWWLGRMRIRWERVFLSAVRRRRRVFGVGSGLVLWYGQKSQLFVLVEWGELGKWVCVWERRVTNENVVWETDSVLRVGEYYHVRLCVLYDREDCCFIKKSEAPLYSFIVSHLVAHSLKGKQCYFPSFIHHSPVTHTCKCNALPNNLGRHQELLVTLSLSTKPPCPWLCLFFHHDRMPLYKSILV